MAEYAGILRRGSSVSRGVKGVFQRYTLHYSIVLVENSLSLGKSYALDDANRSLASTSAHAFVRVQVPGLLGPTFADRCTIDLAPCQRCGTPRISEDARFCMKCGSELKDVSVYDELIHADIENPPSLSPEVHRIPENAIETNPLAPIPRLGRFLHPNKKGKLALLWCCFPNQGPRLAEWQTTMRPRAKRRPPAGWRKTSRASIPSRMSMREATASSPAIQSLALPSRPSRKSPRHPPHQPRCKRIPCRLLSQS